MLSVSLQQQDSQPSGRSKQTIKITWILVENFYQTLFSSIAYWRRAGLDPSGAPRIAEQKALISTSQTTGQAPLNYHVPTNTTILIMDIWI